MSDKTILLNATGISRQFPGVRALRDVDFEVYQGEVIGLVGENGAGKSTLMKILSGVYPFDAGFIELNGQPYRPGSPAEAQALGISTIYQELALIPYLSVAENIFLNREPLRPFTPGLINYAKMNQDAQALLAELGIRIDVTQQLRDLPIAVQQMVEIAKAISRDARLIIMDEPTSSLASSDIEVLFKLIQRLKERGVAVIFIGHRMEEVLAIADRVVVMRDGERTGTLPIEEANEDQIIRLMVGRKVELYPKEPAEITTPVLEVRHLGNGKAIHDINFVVRRGEIVGVAGLIGAGRTEVARMIFGADPRQNGQILIDDVEQKIASPIDAVRAGIALIPEDRKLQGLVLGMDVKENLTLSIIKWISGILGRVQGNKQRDLANDYIQQLDIQTPGLWQTVRNLSGGNQQKVVIAKWLCMHPRVLILDEPTRGIDIGAKAEVHRLMSQLAAQGIGILMISSELPEIIGMSDRVLVMCNGRITGEFNRDELQHAGAQEEIIARATRFDTIHSDDLHENPSPASV